MSWHQMAPKMMVHGIMAHGIMAWPMKVPSRFKLKEFDQIKIFVRSRSIVMLNELTFTFS